MTHSAVPKSRDRDGLVSALELHAFLQQETPYLLWAARILRTSIGILPGLDYVEVPGDYDPQTQKLGKMHYVTALTALRMCILARNEPGFEGALYYTELLRRDRTHKPGRKQTLKVAAEPIFRSGETLTPYVEPPGTPEHERFNFATWLRAMGFSEVRAGRELGISPAQVRIYKLGYRPDTGKPAGPMPEVLVKRCKAMLTSF